MALVRCTYGGGPGGYHDGKIPFPLVGLYTVVMILLLGGFGWLGWGLVSFLFSSFVLCIFCSFSDTFFV